jgi:hypothetical protein
MHVILESAFSFLELCSLTFEADAMLDHGAGAHAPLALVKSIKLSLEMGIAYVPGIAADHFAQVSIIVVQLRADAADVISRDFSSKCDNILNRTKAAATGQATLHQEALFFFSTYIS